eukprot:Platyproteum_vivax@DN4168_c0_g1_i2.p1
MSATQLSLQRKTSGSVCGRVGGRHCRSFIRVEGYSRPLNGNPNETKPTVYVTCVCPSCEQLPDPLLKTPKSEMSTGCNPLLNDVLGPSHTGSFYAKQQNSQLNNSGDSTARKEYTPFGETFAFGWPNEDVSPVVGVETEEDERLRVVLSKMYLTDNEGPSLPPGSSVDDQHNVLGFLGL